jgi:hypothetical protein
LAQFYHIPAEGKAGPQSQLNEACIFLTWFAWHSPWNSGATQLGVTNVSADLLAAYATAESNVTDKVFVCNFFFYSVQNIQINAITYSLGFERNDISDKHVVHVDSDIIVDFYLTNRVNAIKDQIVMFFAHQISGHCKFESNVNASDLLTIF